MKVIFDEPELRPLIERVVSETVERLTTGLAECGRQFAYPEAEAAAMIGVERHVLRDARLRGEIGASRIGKKVIYSRQQLLTFLERRCDK